MNLKRIDLDLPFSRTDTCFLDIETSGYARKTARLCYAGLAVPENGHLTALLWLADKKEEEGELLAALFSAAAPYRTLLTFGGTGFDLPFLRKKCAALAIPFPLEGKEHRDLYRSWRGFQKLLQLPRMDQRTLEGALGLVRRPEDNDLTMLPRLLPLDAFSALFEGHFTVTEAEPLPSEGGFQLSVSLRLSEALPLPVSRAYPSFYLKAEGTAARLLLYGYAGKLKYFFPDYKNYIYFPKMDAAMHKSVAAYAAKGTGIPAKASTCYTKKDGCFVPAADGCALPLFHKEYRDPAAWFLYEDAADRTVLQGYIAALLKEVQ